MWYGHCVVPIDCDVKTIATVMPTCVSKCTLIAVLLDFDTVLRKRCGGCCLYFGSCDHQVFELKHHCEVGATLILGVLSTFGGCLSLATHAA